MKKRQTIIDIMKVRFSTILQINNYRTNCGNHVFDWKTTDFNDSEIPGINIKDLSDNVTAIYSGDIEERELNIEIEIRVAAGPDTPAMVRDAILDINQAIKQDETWGDIALMTSYADGDNDEISIEHDGKTYGGARIRLIVEYRKKRFEE